MDNLRKVAALALHEVRSLAANPSMVATIFVLLSFALLFTDFFHFFEWFSVPFLCQLAVCSIGGIGTVCILAEERERGAEQTLLLSGNQPRNHCCWESNWMHYRLRTGLFHLCVWNNTRSRACRRNRSSFAFYHYSRRVYFCCAWHATQRPTTRIFLGSAYIILRHYYRHPGCTD